MADADPVPTAHIFERASEKAEQFSSLVDKIENAPNETKRLWKEIYENASQDRVNAYILFVDLYRSVAGSTAGHMNHGVLMTKYIERMNKANDQMLKLAELIENAASKASEVDADAVYDEMNAG